MRPSDIRGAPPEGSGRFDRSMYMGPEMPYNETLSGELSSLLRHRGPRRGVNVRLDGLARMSEIVAALQVDEQELKSLMENSFKRGQPRFEMVEHETGTWVRATRKHTLPIDFVLLSTTPERCLEMDPPGPAPPPMQQKGKGWGKRGKGGHHRNGERQFSPFDDMANIPPRPTRNIWDDDRPRPETPPPPDFPTQMSPWASNQPPPPPPRPADTQQVDSVDDARASTLEPPPGNGLHRTDTEAAAGASGTEMQHQSGENSLSSFAAAVAVDVDTHPAPDAQGIRDANVCEGPESMSEANSTSSVGQGSTATSAGRSTPPPPVLLGPGDSVHGAPKDPRPPPPPPVAQRLPPPPTAPPSGPAPQRCLPLNDKEREELMTLRQDKQNMNQQLTHLEAQLSERDAALQELRSKYDRLEEEARLLRLSKAPAQSTCVEDQTAAEELADNRGKDNHPATEEVSAQGTAGHSTPEYLTAGHSGAQPGTALLGAEDDRGKVNQVEVSEPWAPPTQELTDDRDQADQRATEEPSAPPADELTDDQPAENEPSAQTEEEPADNRGEGYGQAYNEPFEPPRGGAGRGLHRTIPSWKTNVPQCNIGDPRRDGTAAAPPSNYSRPVQPVMTSQSAAAAEPPEEFDRQEPFPAGSLVEAHSLSAAALNGLQGRVVGPQGERYRIDFAGETGKRALKPANLKLIGEDAADGAPAVQQPGKQPIEPDSTEVVEEGMVHGHKDMVHAEREQGADAMAAAYEAGVAVTLPSDAAAAATSPEAGCGTAGIGTHESCPTVNQAPDPISATGLAVAVQDWRDNDEPMTLVVECGDRLVNCRATPVQPGWHYGEHDAEEFGGPREGWVPSDVLRAATFQPALKRARDE